MKGIIKYFSTIYKSMAALLRGMSLTLRVFFRKKVTQHYPENRETLKIFDRVAGELVMPHNENNEHKCIACMICQTSCPNGTIHIESKMVEGDDGKRKRVLVSYDYDLGSCLYCELCVRSCPHDAIKFTNTFEHAVFRREKLVLRLNKEGSKLQEKEKTPQKEQATPTGEKSA